MPETLYFKIESDIKTATQDTKQFGDSLQGADEKLKYLNTTLKEQKEILLMLQREEIKLQQERNKMSEWELHISGANKKLEHLKTEIKDQRLAVKDLTMQQREAKDSVKEWQAANKENEGTLGELIGNFQVMGVSLNSVKKGFGQIIPIAKAMFKTIKVGILSTGIGALVLAFGALMTWFTKTKKGAEVLERIFAAVGAVVSVLVDRISKFGSAIAKVWTGDISGAFTDMKESFTGIGAEIQKEIELSVQLKKALQDLADSERELSVQTAERRAEIEELKLRAEDLNLTEQERINALNEATAIEQQLMDQRVANAAEAVRIQKQQMAMTENTKQDLQDLADLEIKLANIKRESAKVQRTLIRKTNEIQRHAAHQERERQNNWIRKQNEITRNANKLRQEVWAIERELRLRQIKDDEKREKKKIEYDYLLQKQALEQAKTNAKFSEEEKQELLLSLREKFESDKQQVTDKFAKDAKDKEEAEDAALTKLRLENKILELNQIAGAQEMSRKERLKQERETAHKIFAAELSAQEVAEYKSIEGMENAEEMKLEIQRKYAQLRIAYGDEVYEKERENMKQLNEARVDMLKDSLSIVNSIMDVQAQTIENNYNKEIKLAEKNGKSTEDIEKKYDDKRKAQAKKFKAMKIAMAVVDTYQAATAAYATALEIPGAGLAMAPIAAGLAVAAGLANIAMIEKQPLGGATGPGPSAPPPPTPDTPAPQMMSGAFELGTGQAPEPMQAFVVSDDITNNQDKLATIRRRATI